MEDVGGKIYLTNLVESWVKKLGGKVGWKHLLEKFCGKMILKNWVEKLGGKIWRKVKRKNVMEKVYSVQYTVM